MVSCTEFIPLYSEFFKFLDKKGGYDAVMEYWKYISENSIGDKTNPHSLASFIERDGGFEGALHYWEHTLSEEASDVRKIYDYKNRYAITHMRKCPSRGLLNSLGHIEPYCNYCEHCKVIYRLVLEKYGIVYERDHSRIDNAECFSLLYEKGNRPDIDYTDLDSIELTADMKNIDMKAEDNEYLHRDFHLLGDLALKYCAEQFGDDAVREFMTDFTKAYYAPLIERVKDGGLSVLKEWIEGIYEIEKASGLLHAQLQDGTLTVTVDKCPVIEYMHSLGQRPSDYYIEQTRTLYDVIAKESGHSFSLEYYNDDGAARFTFTK